MQTNIDAPFFMSKYALPHMSAGGSIINTTSVDAYIAPPTHLDYAASKGAVLTFTRALAHQQASKGIRVNAVAPGPVWTPLIATSIQQESQKALSGWTAMGRIGQPVEIATSFVFLAAQDSSFMTGQTLHPNGGIAVSS
jgi:NAD(P)-dependent dehydrogenase (short-subunit alcohol dehydrogenase family)